MSEHHDSMRAQERENVDPEERIRPIPLAAVLVTLGMVVFGVLYIFLSEPLTNSRWRRAHAGRPGGAAAGRRRQQGRRQGHLRSPVRRLPPGHGQGPAGRVSAAGRLGMGARRAAHRGQHPAARHHGRDQVEGQKFSGQMPSFHQLSDAELAGVASYVRGAWSNKSEPIEPACSRPSARPAPRAPRRSKAGRRSRR
jgi:hypothetical protein